MCALVGEALFSDYSVHELPQESDDSIPSSSAEMSEAAPPSSDISVLVSAALVARVESIESGKCALASQLASQQPSKFCIEEISHSDSLIHFYTGFHTYALLLAFFEFLGPSVNSLQYLGGKSMYKKKHTKLFTITKPNKSTVFDTD